VPSEPLPAWVIARRQAIGDNIRAARERQRPKISQQKLGELVDLDRKTINRIEQGTYATLIDSLIRIAEALGVPLADLVR
jgi:DNA-binding XRE family transcriptional regulator